MFGDFIDVFVLFEAHVSKNREYHESCDETGEAIDSSRYERIPILKKETTPISFMSVLQKRLMALQDGFFCVNDRLEDFCQ